MRSLRSPDSQTAVLFARGSFAALEVMKPTAAQHNAFLAQEPLPGVDFRHNEFVKVVSGDHAGSVGSLVSVEELGGDPVYVLELESGFDVRVLQSQVQRA